MSKELFEKQRELEIHNETLEDIELRMRESYEKIAQNMRYFLTGIQDICQTSKRIDNE